MLLGGLWHGAGWTFALWGLYHGGLLAAHATLSRRGWVPSSRLLATTATVLAVMAGWVLFRSASPGEAFALLGTMSGLRAGEGGHLMMVTGEAAITTLLAAVLVFAAPNTWEIRFPRTRLAAAALAALLVLCVLRFAEPSPFIYFQF
jgi:alginate O-acetyltransferase complex protein AlgI